MCEETNICNIHNYINFRLHMFAMFSFDNIRFSTLDTIISCIQFISYYLFNAQAKAPLLDDDESASRWVFDAISKKQLMNRLWTNMSGSVVCNQPQANNIVQKRKNELKALGQRTLEACFQTNKSNEDKDLNFVRNFFNRKKIP